PANAILCSGDDTGLSANTPKTLVSSCTATKCQYTCNTAGYANVGGTCLRTYTVSYNSNGATSGSAPGSQTKNYNVALTLATNSGNLAKTGYTFAGWNTSVIGNGTDYSAGSLYTTNAAVTLYAKWTLAPAPTVSVSWSKSDGATYYTVYADKSANGGSTRSACSNSNGDQCFTNVTATADATQTKTFTGESAATYKISVWACNTRGCSTSAAVTSAPHISCAQDTCTRSGEFGWGSGCKSSYTGTVAVGSTPITKNNDTALAPGYSGSITLACTATGWQTSNATCTAPDLTAGAITPTTATLGTRTSFSSTIRNTGTGSTGAGFTNLFQSSTNSSGTSNVSTIGTPTTAALAAGASRTVSTDYTFSSAGTFYVRVCADKSSATNQGAISESDETNNCGAWTSVTVPGICTALPSNANAYPAPDNTGLSANKAYTYSATDTSTKCQYACRSGYTPSGGSCIAAACTNLPSNASAYPTPDNTGLSANTAYTYSATDTSTKCQYTCRSGFTSSGGSCVATACTNLPSNASAYPAPDNTGLSANTAYTYSATDTATKCQYTCRSGFTSSGGSCIAAACTNLPSNASAYPTPDNTGLSANTAYTYSATDTSTKCQYTCQNGPAEYFCNDSDRYQRNTNCTEQFVETCWYGCSDGACLLPPPILPVTSGPDQLSGHLQAIPSLVRSGETTRLRWNMDNVSSCSVTGSNGDSWNGGSSGTGGKESSDIVSQTTYTLTCRPLPGAPSDDPVVELVTVNIIPIFEEL
ncbi:MAG: InlB B-repeat-containing protein, partial [bacterium]|nr:InlB B-repeat-containing protein [bacterium]